MTTEWTNVLILVVPVDEAELANNLLTTIWPGGEAEAVTFGLPLSADGNNPPTHLGRMGSLTNELWALALETLQDSAGIGWTWYLTDFDTTSLLATNSGTAVIDDPWDWYDMMTDMGLQEIPDGI